jgi:hypothetical protein
LRGCEEIVRAEVAGHHGRLVKKLGDGQLVEFASARLAVSCAAAIQRAIDARNRHQPDRAALVRIGVNTGEVSHLDGDIHGAAVNVAARITGHATGGEILIADVVRQLLGPHSDLPIRERGAVVLKGLPGTWPVHEVIWDEDDRGVRVSAVGAASGLVGRDQLLTALRADVEGALAGHGGLVLLVGDAGIGKTALATEAAAHAEARGARVVWGTCWEGDGAPGFWPWVQVARALIGAGLPPPPGRDLGRLLPELTEAPASAETDPEQARFLLFDAVCGFVTGAGAGGRPLVVVLDDLHWADPPSLLLLSFVARQLRSARVLIVGTYRDVDITTDDARAPLIHDVERHGRKVALGGLDDDSVMALMTSLGGGAPDAALANAVSRRTGGNPFFVREITQLLQAQGGLSSPHAADAAIPAAVHEVVQRRLARLSHSCVQILTDAAVIGHDVETALVASVGERPLVEVVDAFEEAVRARLVEPGTSAPERYRFAHALVRDALYGDLAAGARAERHRRVANALEARPGAVPLDELAHHFLHAAAGDPALLDHAAEYAEAAGLRALDQLAYERAATHFETALRVTERVAPEDEDRLVRLLLARGDACLRAGDMPNARLAFERVAGVARRLDRPEDLARAALGFGAGLGGFEVTLFDEAQVHLLEEALAALGGADSSLRAWVLARLSVAVSTLETAEHREGLSRAATAMARRVGDDACLAYALSSLCDAIAGPDHVDERLAYATEMVALGQSAGDREMELLGHRFQIVARLELGDIAGVDREIEAFTRVAEALRQPISLWYVPLFRGMRALMRGRLDETERLCAEEAEIGERAHSANAVLLEATLRGHLLLHQGRIGEAADLLRASIADAGWAPEMDYPTLTEAACGVHPNRAALELERLATTGYDLAHDGIYLANLTLLSLASANVDGHPGAERLYELLSPYADRTVLDGIAATCWGSAAGHLGVLAGALGRWEEAEAHFAAALAANRAAGAPGLVAGTNLALGRVLLARDEAGDRERATTVLDDAANSFAELGLTYWEGRARALRPPVNAEGANDSRPANSLSREGDVWMITFEGTTVRVKHTKGLGDLAVLLARQGREVAALDLVGSPGGSAAGHAGELIDARARAAYESRVRDLQEEIDEAEADNDSGRAERAVEERDFILAELASAVGLGGRIRRAGDPTERARSTVTQRLRDAIGRIASAHPALGRHLQRSVRTGVFCAYEPEQPTEWDLTS